MKSKKYLLAFSLVVTAFFLGSCEKQLDEPRELETQAGSVDYTSPTAAKAALVGAYQSFYDFWWEHVPVLSVRGDDVNSGGGRNGVYDQAPFHDIDMFVYDANFWMINNAWDGLFQHVLQITAQIEQLEKFRAGGVNGALVDQYIAECKVLKGWLTLQLSRTFGGVFKVTSTDPTLLSMQTKDEIMNWIKTEMADASGNLPDLHPNQRTDLKGGVTKYTALAVKALAEQELKDYNAVAATTGAIIASNKFKLYGDFNKEFKTAGKLSSENLLEVQYSVFNSASGDSRNYLNDFFGPTSWTPVVSAAGGGWGFYEPSEKYVKFMLDRNEQVRLRSSVLFTPDGIAKIKSDPMYATLPAWVTNTTIEGDIFLNSARAYFYSGKHYLPSVELIPGRTGYGSNKNMVITRYAEILLMYAEAVTRGGTPTAGTADAAINLVRERAGLGLLTGVTSQQVVDEKYAELAMEWGTRYYDMVRLENVAALSYEGRTFTMAKKYLPYPLPQLDKSILLKEYFATHPDH
ncbi:MAG: RagB/SusD family nutrient uptake outer membrane protein [Chitinophagaceae bacterium]|nr:MAG: RagB/SusD family nutrient uptake outer membrane protein [Chitinophagaceae bacterium]